MRFDDNNSNPLDDDNDDDTSSSTSSTATNRLTSATGATHSSHSATGIEHATAGATAAAVAVLALHPLDVVKVRLQAQSNGTVPGRMRYNNMRDAFRSIAKVEGVRGLYSGLSANLTGSVMAWASYFYLYEWLKSRLEETDDDGVLEAPQHMLCAYQAGLVTATLTNPIWVIKTRMMLQTPDGVARYNSTRDAFGSILRDEGFRGLYRGYAPALIGVAHGAVQFSVYEQFKRFIKRHSLDGDVGYFCAGAASKVVATVITYPYQVIRTRLQDRPPAGEARRFTSTWSTIVTTWRAEGIRGMYRGLGPGVLRVMPQSAIVFMVYERVLKILQRK